MVKPKKYLGQHFLTDNSIAKKTANLVINSHSKNILEIGPGKGILTKQLINIKEKEIYAIEIDNESVEFLEYNEIIKKPYLINGDFLKLNLNKTFNENFIIIGNFPYNISSQIIFKMLEYRDKIDFMAGMFQKEVAQRIVSKPNNKTYGILSVLVQAFYDAKIEFKVNPGSFFPPPKVDSAVISCKRKVNFKLNCDEILFFDIVKTSFNQRRKTLLNSLSKYNLKKIDPLPDILKLRPENLTVDDFVELVNLI